jgi:hypothetical protein
LPTIGVDKHFSKVLSSVWPPFAFLGIACRHIQQTVVGLLVQNRCLAARKRVLELLVEFHVLTFDYCSASAMDLVVLITQPKEKQTFLGEGRSRKEGFPLSISLASVQDSTR